ncbi:MAG: ATP-binding protein [Bacteroidales bacterium]|jgi:MinD superfamily P-loop ATPase|nr:ATP-binding protein [Bacteroidales bacterium]
MLKELAVISGKGGTGKSSITAAFATMVNQNVVLADCDVDAANLHIIMEPEIELSEVYIAGEKAVIDYDKCSSCGVCQGYCRFNAISFFEGRYIIDEISCDGCKLCEKVCPSHAISMEKSDKSRMHSGTFRNGKMVYGRLEPGEENSGKLVAMVRSKCREIAKKEGIDTILIDSPPGIGCAVISSISGATNVLVVTEPSLSAMSDLDRTLQLLENYNIKKGVVINKYDLSQSVADKIINLCESRGIEIVGMIPFDREVVDAMVNRKSIVEWNPASIVSKEIISIWNKII